MRYKVPQDVQREDQILWFITLRQLIMLMVGFGISYFFFTKLKKSYNLNEIEIALTWTPAAISVALSFLKIKGIPLIQFLTLILEQMVFRRAKRYWSSGGGDPSVSMTTNVTPLQKKTEETIEEKKFSQKKAQELAKFLDGQKSDFSPNNTAKK